jgi:hypothetical protein
MTRAEWSADWPGSSPTVRSGILGSVDYVGVDLIGLGPEIVFATILLTAVVVGAIWLFRRR